MRIAHCVESYTPAVGGMAEVARQLSERMVRAGHEVTVYTSWHPQRTNDVINGVRIRSFHVGGNAVAGITGDADAYVKTLRNSGHDVITLFAAQQWATDAVLPQLAGITAKKVFVPTGFSALHQPTWRAYFELMPAWLRAMDLNIFHSQGYQDVRFAERHGIRNRVLIPNGAAEEEFGTPPEGDLKKSLGLGSAQPVILHVGSYSGIKGHKEAIRIFLKAAVDDAVLLFIGNGVKMLERSFRTHWRFFSMRSRAAVLGKRIFFQERARKDTVSAMKQADLFLLPSQMECSPIVLFESIAAGTPFLASRAGNAEEIAAWTGGGWTVGGAQDATGCTHIDIDAAAALLARLVADTASLRKAGEAGHKAWREHYTWESIAERYMQEYERLLK